MNARTPDLFILGAPKAGTTALASYLSAHPNIYMCVPKEPGYWGRDFPAYLHKQHGIRDFSDYIALFDNPKAHSARYAGEGSTHYLVSNHAVEEILALNADARFIVMLRNPVDLVHALHGEALFKRHETVSDFEQAWRLQDRRAHGEAIPESCRVPRFLQYREAGALGTQLRRALGQVERTRVYIGFFDDFYADPGAEYRRILHWLGVVDDGQRDFPCVNASKVQRSRVLANLVHAPPPPLAPLVRTLRRAYRSPRIGAGNFVDRLMTREARRTPLRREFRTELAEHFASEVRDLEHLTGRDLSDWRDA